MTKQEADKKVAAMLATQTMDKLLSMWEKTSSINEPETPTVRGWLMDEFYRRNPEGFDRWIDSLDPKDETLKDYMLV